MTLTILILSSFVDRDMVMRYHWGLGVGHVYSHSDCTGNGIIQNQTADGEHEQEADEQDEGVYCSTSDTRGGGEEEHQEIDESLLKLYITLPLFPCVSTCIILIHT